MPASEPAISSPSPVMRVAHAAAGRCGPCRPAPSCRRRRQIAAGPSHGSITRVAVAVQVAVRLAAWSGGSAQASGISIVLTIGRLRPARTSSLEHVVERRGVRAAGLDDRLHVLDRARRRPACAMPRLVALHPVDVALQRVDLAVVGEHAERLGQLPGAGRCWSNSAGDRSRSARRSARPAGRDRRPSAARPGTCPCR